MTDMEIPQAAIEAGAAVLTDWFDVPKSAPACVKEVLRAALPHLLTEVKSTLVTPAYDKLWRALAEAEMAHRGYTPEEIEVANRVPSHTPDCEFEHNTYSWICDDGDGKSFHPIADEYGEIVDMFGRALETLSERSATEVKSMCETAGEFGRAIGRKEALERAVVEIEAASAGMYYGDQHVLHEAVEVIRNMDEERP